jgi:hypothetical protein
MPHDRGCIVMRGEHLRGEIKAGLGQRLISSGTGATLLPMNAPTPFPTESDRVAFDRAELNHILSLYGRMVSAGEWRDYGLSFLREVAVFSVFRRAAEHPLYRIEKRPRLRGRQGMYAVIGMDGQILKRGHDLRSVLRVLDRKLIRPVE